MATSAEPAPSPRTGTNGLRSAAAVAMGVAALLVGIPYLVPGLERLRLLTPLPEGQGLILQAPEPDAPPVGEADVPDLSADTGAELALPERVELPAEAHPLAASVEREAKPPVSIEDETGEALAVFFRALAAVERKQEGALARISFWGDSNVAGDLVTAVLRRKLQDRFGDGGHGFVLIANPTPYYFHNDVWRQANHHWAISRIPGPLAADGLYGMGGVSFRAKGPAAVARLGTAKKGSYGRSVGRFVIDYLAHPKGAELEVRIDGSERDVIDTRAEQAVARAAAYDVVDGAHELELVTRGADVRLFGVRLEREGPAVIVDALGVTSSKIRHLSRIESTHFAAQLRTLNPALAVFNFGVNESREGERQFGVEEYETTMTAVLKDVRAALPEASCLLVSPNDIAWKTPKGDLLSLGFVAKLAESQRKVAAQQGCAYWNMYQAMGGAGSMGKWVKKGLAKPDMLHPTAAGATFLGTWLYQALMEAYGEFKATR
ncbi:MAG: hypothetical protein JRI23_29020 [Deltaproteobacteria bacterium]|jgi:lysophospholipase L1-like esterase|nr:hypothetical protein [Deltaproteobacteria bacterium]MBW2536173.1 hypothetical protein [Deltaproteobacteria bacterium]